MKKRLSRLVDLFFVVPFWAVFTPMALLGFPVVFWISKPDRRLVTSMGGGLVSHWGSPEAVLWNAGTLDDHGEHPERDAALREVWRTGQLQEWAAVTQTPTGGMIFWQSWAFRLWGYAVALSVPTASTALLSAAHTLARIEEEACSLQLR